MSEKFAPNYLNIIDNSRGHAEHAAMRAANPTHTETHLEVLIVAECFAGKSLVQRHRMIYDVVGRDEWDKHGLHALNIVAKTPSEQQPHNNK